MNHKKNHLRSVIILALGLLADPAIGREVKDIVPEVIRAAANMTVVQAVKEQNAKGTPLSRIQELDKDWMAAKEPTPFMQSHNSNSAAKTLGDIEKSTPYLVEFILTDNQGANVAVTGMTSDYWQGDEPKFTNAYAGGAGSVYIARPQKDKSTGIVISQVSVPVLDGGKAIGTLTVGVRIDRLK